MRCVGLEFVDSEWHDGWYSPSFKQVTWWPNAPKAFRNPVSPGALVSGASIRSKLGPLFPSLFWGRHLFFFFFIPLVRLPSQHVWWRWGGGLPYGSSRLGLNSLHLFTRFRAGSPVLTLSCLIKYFFFFEDQKEWCWLSIDLSWAWWRILGTDFPAVLLLRLSPTQIFERQIRVLCYGFSLRWSTEGSTCRVYLF